LRKLAVRGSRIAALLVAAMMLGVLMRPPSGVLANPGVSVSISPASLTVQPGQAFTVDVVVESDVAVRGVQGALTFDPAMLEAGDVTEGNYLKDWAEANGNSTLVFPEPKVDNGAGQISDIGIAVMGTNPGGVTGSGWPGPTI
jgi:hypothetical protein